MEVLKHGKYYNKNKDTIECGCGCKFKYTEEDKMTVRDSNTLLKNYTYVKCPECGGIHQLSIGVIYT